MLRRWGAVVAPADRACLTGEGVTPARPQVRLAEGGPPGLSGRRAQPVEPDVTGTRDRRLNFVLKFVLQDPCCFLGVVADHRRKLPAPPLDAAVLDGLEGVRHRVKPELLDEQLRQVLSTAGPHPGAANGPVQFAQFAAVVWVVPGQQTRDRTALSVNVPVAARRGVHLTVEVQAQKRVAVEPQLELSTRPRLGTGRPSPRQAGS